MLLKCVGIGKLTRQSDSRQPTTEAKRFIVILT